MPKSSYKMIALRRFRVKDESGTVWIEKGETYTLSSKKLVKFHQQTKRGIEQTGE